MLDLIFGILIVVFSDLLVYGFLNNIIGPGIPSARVSSSFAIRVDIISLTLAQILTVIILWTKRRNIAIGILVGIITVPIFLLIWFFAYWVLNPSIIS